MNTSDNNLKDLMGTLDVMIDEWKGDIPEAFRRIDSFNISADELRKQTVRICGASFFLSLLTRIKKVAARKGYKMAKQYIRFLKFQFEAKASEREDTLGVLQKTALIILRELMNI